MAITGVLSAAGACVERSKYGTPEAVGSGNQLHFVSESFTERTTGDRQKDASGDIELRLAYGGGGLQHLLAAFLFSHLDKSPVSTAGGLYLHAFELERAGRSRTATVWDSANPSGKTVNKRVTILIDRSGKLAEVVSFEPDSLNLSFTEDARITISGYAARINSNPEANTGSSGLSFSYFPVGLVKLSETVIKLYPLNKFTFSSAVTIDIKESGAASAVSITISAGSYYGGQLAREIEKQLNSSALSGRYAVKWDGIGRKFHIVSDTSFSIEATGTANERLGFPNGSGLKTIHFSEYPAITDGMDSTGIEIKAADVAVTISGGKQRKQVYGSFWEIGEGYPEKTPDVRVTINLHRADDGLPDIADISGEFFAVSIEAAHPSGTGKLSVYLPELQLTAPTAPVTGSEIIKERLPFKSVDTSFPALGLFFSSYHFRSLPQILSGGTPLIIHVAAEYNGKIYASDELGGVYRLDDSGWVSVASIGDAVRSMLAWRGKLYLGTEVGDVYVYDGNTATLLNSISASAIIRFEVFRGNLWALDEAGGVFEYDGAAWTSRPISGASIGHDIVAFNGKIYALVRVTNEKVFAFDGSVWTQVLDFGYTDANGSLAVTRERGIIYANAGSGLRFSRDGSTWTTVTNSVVIKHMVGYLAELIAVASNGSVYWFDFDKKAMVSLVSAGTTPREKPLLYRHKLLIPIDSSLQYITFIHKLRLEIEDKTNANPYL